MRSLSDNSSIGKNRMSFGLWPMRLLLVVHAIAYYHPIRIVMAVDRTKFRTCEQTSFCRRHRLNVETNSAPPNRPSYQVIKESIQFDSIVRQETLTNTTTSTERGGGNSRRWPAIFSLLSKHSNASQSSVAYRRAGPKPSLTAILSPANEDKDSNNNNNNPTFQLSLSWTLNGIVRVQVTETLSQRWIADDLVLTEIEASNPEDLLHTRELELLSSDEELQQLMRSVGAETSQPSSNFIGIKFSNKNHSTNGVDATPTVTLVQLNPFQLHLIPVNALNEPSKPLLSVNSRQLFQFEHIRKRETAEQRRLATASGKKDDDPQESEDRHHGKEIVDYGEDGLAVYADGTREERYHEEEEEHHRALMEDYEAEQEGMWEESFHSHQDSKPFGPTALSVDISFPSSHHLYGLPEHASSSVLKPTIGPHRHYSEPYRLYNLDVFEYELDEPMALYGSIPFLVAMTEESSTVGVFYFNPTETFVDVSHDLTNENEEGTSTHWISESGILDIFLLPGPTPRHVYKQYATLTGYQVLPPMFALGYHQCRWNYRDEKDVKDVHGHFEDLDYPYDVLWLDIEHTDGKRYFTWDNNAFPNPEAMQNSLWSQGRRMVTIIDPHIKRDDGYRIHKEATRLGLYIKDSSGKKDFDGWCWPGSSSYLDFTAEKVRLWWAEQFKYENYKGSTPHLFTWNDMNEPSVFNGPEVSMQKDLLNIDGIEHRQWHNLYGMLFHRSTHEGLLKRNSGETVRSFVLSRSFYAGSQKYGAIWTGDNKAEWSHLVIAAPMLLSLNVAALSFVGADVGGFFGDPDAELMTRWMQAGAYQPFFRGHAHHDSKRREPWMFGEEWTTRMRRAAMARYALLPYLYTVFYEASITGMPVMRSMWMEYPADKTFRATDDQWLLGSDLLVKPVTFPGASSIEVMLPQSDLWYDVDSMKRMPGSSSSEYKILAKVSIDKIPVYQRGGSIIPRKLRLRRSSEMMKYDPYTLYIALNQFEFAAGSLYIDDEISLSYKQRKYCLASFEFKDGTLSNKLLHAWKESLPHSYEIERLVFMGLKQEPKSVTLQPSGPASAFQPLLFNYFSDTNVLIVKKPGVSAIASWEIRLNML